MEISRSRMYGVVAQSIVRSIVMSQKSIVIVTEGRL